MINKTMARSIANSIFREASELSSSGSWIMYYMEIEGKYNVKLTEEDIKLIVDTIKELYYDWAVLEITSDDESIDVQLADNYIEAEIEGENKC